MDRVQEITAWMIDELRKYQPADPAELTKSMRLSPRGAKIACDILLKARDVSKLVRVERMRQDKTGPHPAHYYISPDQVKSTDKVIGGNTRALDEYRKKKAGKGSASGSKMAKDDRPGGNAETHKYPKLSQDASRKIAKNVNKVFLGGEHSARGYGYVAGYAYADFGYQGAVDALKDYMKVTWSQPATLPEYWDKIYKQAETPYGESVTDWARTNWTSGDTAEIRNMERKELGEKPKKDEILAKVYSEALNAYANSRTVNKRLFRGLSADSKGQLREYTESEVGDEVSLGALSSCTSYAPDAYDYAKPLNSKERVLLEIEPSDELRGAPADDPIRPREYLVPDAVFTVTGREVDKHGVVRLRLKLKEQ